MRLLLIRHALCDPVGVSLAGRTPGIPLNAAGRAGRLWAGDAPYGVNTPTETSVGVGLLGAFPPGSRRLWRVDIAKPLSREPGTPKFRIILDNRDLTRAFWREPGDLSNGRERSAPASLYNWP